MEIMLLFSQGQCLANNNAESIYIQETYSMPKVTGFGGELVEL